MNQVTTLLRGSIVPFTGPIFAIWAFFDPTGFGRWFGTIVQAFRSHAGF